jgi:hypothetical protein
VNKGLKNSEQRLTQASIGRALGLSRSLIHRYVGMGMPTTSIAAARAWHQDSIRPTAHGLNEPDKAHRRERTPTPASVVQASALMAHAADALATGQDITVMVPALRAALRAVPARERAAMLLQSEVMDVLTADAFAVVHQCDSSEQNTDNNEPMTEAEAEELGRFWFKVAAGEIVVDPTTNTAPPPHSKSTPP